MRNKQNHNHTLIEAVLKMHLTERQPYLFPLRHTPQIAPFSKRPKADTPSDGTTTPGSIKSNKGSFS